MTYAEYIRSPEWKRKSKARIALDGYRCRVCDHDGSKFQLEVHHRPSSYSKIPNESIADDLTTLCSRHHEDVTNSIREDIYNLRELEPTTITTIVQARQEINHGLERIAIQTDFGTVLPTHNAQRANSRSAKQVVEITQGDFVQEIKDRR